mmetsp:Transcript_21111/g.38186  ORF Transcript_21111/g.38186 Transcript_21111/m.38186 type:complete len:248 (+) Transcript_21111:138-881(+)|eukprot:CAMPEP_0201881236 /NCGR_PEP_ID=MMETSP0902-20130614/11600_1 /ASSEMBLY_ACC=CAM_ASM_000551 /TAXON_ID=420261 /ORGANISM="Thalassiosira antarctica, Strain CCMP982" /LENGTH=247 /DNA_ID=CAMNT_0048409393 /DNA_START=42 /DNA_END=785 /DNA_ORIENTATION=+
MFQTLCIVLCLATIGRQAVAFSPIKSESRPLSLIHQQSALNLHKSHDRRTFLVQKIITPAIVSVAATFISPHSAHADVLLMDKGVPDVSPFKGSAEEAKKRFQLAIRDIDNLLNNYDILTMSGGDNVRLYLGTQGVKSNMFGIMKVLKLLKEEADDIVEYTEAMDEFEVYLFQAEGAAYQSMFIEHSSAKGTPESMLKTAKSDITNMRKFMSDLAKQLNIDELKIDNATIVSGDANSIEVRGRSRGT